MSVRKLASALAALTGAAFSAVSGSALAEKALNMREGVTPISQEIYDLHMIILYICTAIGVVVFSVMIWSMIAHRKSKGAVAAQFHENHKLEIVWTVLPFVILIGMAIPATKTLLALEDASNPDMTIKVTGYQWKWQYEYIDDGVSGANAGDNISFFSSLSTPREQIENKAEKGENYLLEVDNHVVVPVGKKVRVLTTAADVIHNWWVPDFGYKKDAIPGFINESWFKAEKEGTYRGKCAELCGKDHGFMPVVVDVVSQADYAKWVKGQKGAMAAEAAAGDKTFTKDELMAKGEKVYNANCVACHQANGQGLPNVFPALAGGKITTGPVNGHLDIVVNGSKVNPAMASYGAQLSDVDLAAVITYERNAWGNDLGDVVQPADVKNFKAGK